MPNASQGEPDPEAVAFFEGPQMEAAAIGVRAALQPLGIEADTSTLANIALCVLVAFERAGGFGPESSAILRRVVAERAAKGAH